MPRETAYWVEFLREAIEKELARKIIGTDIIEALKTIKILVHWKKRCQVVDEGRVIKEWWVDGWGLVVYEPGQVLCRRWRLASDWEQEEWKSLSLESLKGLGVLRKYGGFDVQIVKKVNDLPAAIRQFGRHIPAEMVRRPREKFTLSGDAQILTIYAERLSGLLPNLLKSPKSSVQLTERISRETEQLSLFLGDSRTSLKKKILEETQSARQGKFWMVASRTSQTITDLLNQRAEDYEIALKSIELAEKLYELTLKIERKIRHCYYRLGRLGERLQKLILSGEEILPKNLLSIAKEAHGIWIYLMESPKERIPNFGPYYQRLRTPEFQRLSRVVEHAEAGKTETVLNDITEATAKLEAVAMGEKPTRAELQRTKETIL